MAIGSFISVGRSLDDAIARVRLAEDLGYDAAYVTHIAGRDSLTVLAGYAAATSRIGLGTGVVPIYTRTPATMAMTAATLHEQSGGRLRLGLGVSHRAVVEGWHGQTIDKPVAEMREYVAILRAILAGEPPPAGEKWQTSFALSGIGPYPDLPIYVAALSPAMLRLAGEVADGVMLWLCNPEYIREVVLPEVTAGRERAGKTSEGFEVVAAVPSAIVDDPGPALRGHAPRPVDLLRPALLPRDARALGLRRGHRRLRRGRRARRRRGDAGGDLRSLPARAVRDRLARGGARGRGALLRRRDHGPVRGPDRQDRLRGDPAGGGARAEVEPHASAAPRALTAAPRGRSDRRFVARVVVLGRVRLRARSARHAQHFPERPRGWSIFASMVREIGHPLWPLRNVLRNARELLRNSAPGTGDARGAASAPTAATPLPSMRQ